MPKKKRSFQSGFTIVELAMAIGISVIVVLGIGVVLVDSQRGWNTMYNRIYSDVATDGFVARRTFDAVIRKASSEKILLDSAGNWIEIYYYADSSSTAVDCYARFYYDNGTLKAEYGDWDPDDSDPRTVTRTDIISSNVSSCVFKGQGRSVQMILTLDNGTQTATVTSSAVMHNQ